MNKSGQHPDIDDSKVESTNQDQLKTFWRNWSTEYRVYISSIFPGSYGRLRDKKDGGRHIPAAETRGQIAQGSTKNIGSELARCSFS